MTLLAGVSVASLLASRGAVADWSKWSDVGETFGAFSSIIGGLTLLAVVVTARMQYQEMRQGRKELEHQRQSLVSNHLELQRTAAANLGMLHLEILKLSIEDPELAEVWPPYEPDLPPELNRQYLYANIICQFQFRALQDGNYSDEQVTASLRYLFTSPLMRSYWRAAEFGRESLPADSPEYAFSQKVDAACREFEAVVASAKVRAEHGPTLQQTA
ncbi:DUF6082 family protein [Jidongwangia harbinensis]|uniref:DUF6082 family protein n=1 Tax=Jidongwangia harbinensis TaxID=2878561 RepID=UPI001CD9C63D|nr:DUF6082 family protein [Jidongwangia harbinensis]MCA2216139.1 DUF6082 family protein [Jidongwangia harbinensis]